MRASVFIATSLDGYIARESGAIDWLPDSPPGDPEDYGYHAFMADVDCLVMGRASFETVLRLGGWHYGQTPVFVLSSREVAIPADLPGRAEWMSGSPGEIAERLGARGFRHAYVDGGVTIQRFLEAGLIQRMTITRIPVLLGGGIPLFGTLSRDVHWSHVSTRSFPNGLVQSTYQLREEAGLPGGGER